MIAPPALALLLALDQPGPPTPNPAPPTPPPLVSPTPVPSPSPSASPSVPVTAPSPAPSGAPTPPALSYVVTPAPNAATAAAPHIVAIALNDKVLHQGQNVIVRVTTSPDVTAVVARMWGREIGIPQAAPGVFGGEQQLPSGIPFFMLNRLYQVDFVASTADGHSATLSVPIRLER